MKIAASGWVYDVPPETEFIEVTPMDGERAFVSCFDAAGDPLPRLSGDLLSNVAPVQPWPKRVAA